MTDSTENTPEGGFYLKLSPRAPSAFCQPVSELLSYNRVPVEVFRADPDANRSSRHVAVMSLGEGLTTNHHFALRYESREAAERDARHLANDEYGMARLKFQGRKGSSTGFIEWLWNAGPIDVERGSAVRINEVNLDGSLIESRQVTGVVTNMTPVDLEGDNHPDGICFLYVKLQDSDEELRCEVNSNDFAEMHELLERKLEVVEGESAKTAQYVVGVPWRYGDGVDVWLSEKTDDAGETVYSLTRDYDEALKTDAGGLSRLTQELPHACAIVDMSDGRYESVMIVEKSEEGMAHLIEVMDEGGYKHRGVVEELTLKRQGDGSCRAIVQILLDRVDQESGVVSVENRHYEIPPDFMSGLAGKASERTGGGQLQYQVMDAVSVERGLNKADMGIVAANQAKESRPSPGMNM